MRIVVAVGGNALLERGQRSDAVVVCAGRGGAPVIRGDDGDLRTRR